MLKPHDGPLMRQRILACVAETPSIHMNDAANQLGVAWNTLGHHVRRLEARGELVTRRVANRTELYPAGLPPVIRRLISALRDPDCRHVLQEIHDAHPDARGVYEMSAKLVLSRKVVLRHVTRLLEEELIVKVGRTSRPRYRSGLTPALAVQFLGEPRST
jgi:predicted transcriptional regulator